MWIVTLLLFLQAVGVPSGPSPCQAAAPAPTPSGAPTFVVQVVDPDWRPIPGADVRIRLEVNGKEEKTEEANNEGYAKFWFKSSQLLHTYTIEAKYPGFKRAELKHIPSPNPGAPLATAYVQLRLPLNLKDSVTVE